MSLNIFPSNLPGLTWDVTKTQVNSTKIQTANNGLEYRLNKWSYGIYRFQLGYSVLRSASAYNELQTLLGFCLAQQGQFTPFCYSDPTDYSVTGQALGTGNGTQTAFPLVRTLGGYAEPVNYANTVSAVYLNGTPQIGTYTLTQSGNYGLDTITFNTAPGNGVAVTADFTYYFVCRFSQDEFDFDNFQNQFWEMKKIKFQSLK